MNIKMEAFDLMHYLNGRSYEPLIHGIFRLSGHLDFGVLKKAVDMSKEAVPVIFSTFCINDGKPFWKMQDFTADDIASLVDAKDTDEEHYPYSLLSTSIDIEKEPQLKLIVVRYEKNDILLTIMNHMITDGAGFKTYLYLLAGLYSYLSGEKTEVPDLRPYPRDTAQLFRAFGLKDKLKIIFSKYDRSGLKEQPVLDFEGSINNPIFKFYVIGKEELLKTKAYAKEQCATLNDVLFAAFARAFAKRTSKRRIVLPCPADLRKYSQEAINSVSNLTTNFICDIDIPKDSTFKDTLSQVSSQLGKQKNSWSGLKPVIALELLFRLVPFKMLLSYFTKVNTVPVLSFTNVGVISKDKLHFREAEVTFACVSGALKYAPFFQVVASSFDDRIILGCNMYGSSKDSEEIDIVFRQIHQEIKDCIRKE